MKITDDDKNVWDIDMFANSIIIAQGFHSFECNGTLFSYSFHLFI